MKVKELMSHNVASVSIDCVLADAARVMWEMDCGFVPVVENGGKVLGVVTDRDICMAVYTQGLAPAQIPVSVAMAHEVVTCREDDELLAAHSQMRKNQIRRLPVVDLRGTMVGVISMSDLARASLGASGSVAKRDLADTLAEISRERQPH